MVRVSIVLHLNNILLLHNREVVDAWFRADGPYIELFSKEGISGRGVNTLVDDDMLLPRRIDLFGMVAVHCCEGKWAEYLSGTHLLFCAAIRNV